MVDFKLLIGLCLTLIESFCNAKLNHFSNTQYDTNRIINYHSPPEIDKVSSAVTTINLRILSLALGLSKAVRSREAIIFCIITSIVVAALAADSFCSMGNICNELNVSSYQEAWSQLISPNTSWIISLAILLNCLLSSISYTMIIGDIFSTLASFFQLPLLSDRTTVIALVTLLVYLPLSFATSMAFLAPFSLLGLAGVSYAAIVMVSHIVNKDPSLTVTLHQLDSALSTLTTLAEQGAESNLSNLDSSVVPLRSLRAVISSKIDLREYLSFLSMCCTSFFAHYLAPALQHQMQDSSAIKFRGSVNAAFSFAWLVATVVMLVGFVSFPLNHAQGNVLNNYPSDNIAFSLARAAVGVSVMASFPIIFQTLIRELKSLLKQVGSLLHQPAEYKAFFDESEVNRFVAIASRAVDVSVLLAIAAAAVWLRDMGSISSLAGSVLAIPVMFVVPAAMRLKMRLAGRRRSLPATSETEVSAAVPRIEIYDWLVLFMGIFLSFRGTLSAIFKI